MLALREEAHAEAAAVLSPPSGLLPCAEFVLGLGAASMASATPAASGGDHSSSAREERDLRGIRPRAARSPVADALRKARVGTPAPRTGGEQGCPAETPGTARGDNRARSASVIFLTYRSAEAVATLRSSHRSLEECHRLLTGWETRMRKRPIVGTITGVFAGTLDGRRARLIRRTTLGYTVELLESKGVQQ